MKPYPYILFFSVMLTYNCSSQLKIGVKTGINYGNLLTTLIPFDNGESYSNLLSYKAGLTLTYPVNKWKIHSGFLISLRGTCTQSFFYPQKIHEYYGFFEIPFIVSRSVYKDKFEIGLGAVYALNGGRPVILIGDTD